MQPTLLTSNYQNYFHSFLFPLLSYRRLEEVSKNTVATQKYFAGGFFCFVLFSFVHFLSLPTNSFLVLQLNPIITLQNTRLAVLSHKCQSQRSCLLLCPAVGKAFFKIPLHTDFFISNYVPLICFESVCKENVKVAHSGTTLPMKLTLLIQQGCTSFKVTYDHLSKNSMSYLKN